MYLGDDSSEDAFMKNDSIRYDRLGSNKMLILCTNAKGVEDQPLISSGFNFCTVSSKA